MKTKALWLGSLPAFVIAGGLIMSKQSPPEKNYQQRTTSYLDVEQNIIEHAFQYQRLMKGDYTYEEYNRAKQLALSVGQDRASFSWVDHGPDNVGGRTRAIIVDRNNVNHLYAGSVSGGLFESINRAGTWQKVETFNENLAISSICQTVDGTFYVATGHEQEETLGTQAASETGANGYGVYKSNPDGSWSLISGTEAYKTINEVVCDDFNNVVWIASNTGLKKYTASTGTLEDVDTGISGNPYMHSLSISPDGMVLIGLKHFQTIVSTDGGNNFIDVSNDDNTPNPIDKDAKRVEYAISHEKVDGKYRVYASAANNFLKGVWRSEDNGINWDRIAPPYDGVTPGLFSPFATGAGTGQGEYDNIITVVPDAPDKIFLGGVNCYQWIAGGNWEQVSMSFLDKTSPLYVHADNHEMTWDQWGRLYIGNDGGISYTDNALSDDPTFTHANRGYNVTQFYATGFSAHGDVIGGTQDNGTNANWHVGTTYQEHDQVDGSDGFSANISFINRNLIFTSVFFSGVSRSSDRGVNSNPFFPEQFLDPGASCSPGNPSVDAVGCGQFFTNFEMWEHPNDIASTDSILFIPDRSYAIGETMAIPSATSQTFINHESLINTVYDDTLYHDPLLTFDDTVATGVNTLDIESDYNLGILNWEFIDGAPEISEGDSILIIGVEESDTVIITSYITIDHYIGTNPAKPGVQIDMGNEEELYAVSWDTVKVQDRFQSWFALDMGATGIWMTRNALRFSAPTQGWLNVIDNATGIGGNISSMEFSKNGDYLFIGTWGGRLYRYTGFNQAYSPIEHIPGSTIGGITYDTIVDHLGNKFVTEFEQIASYVPNIPITGIASGAIGDPDHLVITLGSFSGTDNKVQQCHNATGVAPTFNSANFPTTGEGSNIPCYSVVIDRDNPAIIVVGTEFGIYATENGNVASPSWSNVSGDFGSTPVYDLGQNWRMWDEGCKRPGEIYAGTHGRGIWSTDALLSTDNENDNLDKTKFEPNLNLYPNPVNEQGTIAFNLESKSDVLLQVFNLNGQVVMNSNNQNLEAGQNQIDFDTSQLPSGTYILRLSTDSMVETTKFIKR